MGCFRRSVYRAMPTLVVSALCLAAAGSAAAEGWTVGSLAVPRVQSPALAGFGSEKLRLFSLSLPGLAGVATLRSWVSAPPSGNAAPSSGFLIDIPLGSSFSFTPSIGAGVTNRPFSGTPSLEVRSQLELGYQFDNRSRFSVGISRSSGDRGRAEGDDVFAFYYRLPLGW